MCHAASPLTMWVWRTSRWVGVPPSQPSPYFHDAGLMPGSRSKVSTLVPVSQSMLLV